VTEKNRILYHWRIRTEKEVTPDELGILVTNLFQSAGATTWEPRKEVLETMRNLPGVSRIF
jgi:pantothenate kinase type III